MQITILTVEEPQSVAAKYVCLPFCRPNAGWMSHCIEAWRLVATRCRLGAAVALVAATALLPVAAEAQQTLPVVTVTAKNAQVIGGESAEFILTRTGDMASALPVGISVIGDEVSGTPPTTATFQANSATATVQVATNTLTAGAFSQLVMLTIEPGSGTEYTVGSSSTATVTVTAPPAAVLETPAALVHAVASVGRSAAAEIVDSIWRRADARRAGVEQSHATLGGRVLDTRALSSGDAGRAVREVASLLGLQASAPDGSLDALDAGYSHGGGIDDYRAWAGIPDAGRLADQTSFALLFGDGMDVGVLVVWGEYSVASYESEPSSGSSVDAESSSVTFGFDMPVSSDTLLGLVVSRSSGESDYEDVAADQTSGSIETSLTGFAPYVHWTMPSGLGVWGSFGMGDGELTSKAGGGSVKTDFAFQVLAGGARSEVGSYGGGRLSLKGDAMLTSTEVDEASSSTASFSALDAGASRARLALELVGSRESASGNVISHKVELGARMDRGDADEGAGADAAFAIDYVIPDMGLEMRAQSSMLLLHSQEGFKGVGLGFGAVYDPGIAERGASLSLEPTWNAPSVGVAESMWRAQNLGGHAASDAGAALKARLGYGAEARRVRALATLYGEAETGEDDRRLRLGAELRGLDGPLERLSLDIYGERRESRSSRPDGAVMLEGRLGF